MTSYEEIAAAHSEPRNDKIRRRGRMPLLRKFVVLSVASGTQRPGMTSYKFMVR